jgi:tetratricopeptide (TPR) repeat protein
LAAGPVAVVALRGLGGVGKSQLALEYAHRMRQSGRYQLAGWVRADSPVTVAEDLAGLAPLLGLPVEGTVGEIAAQVISTLRTRLDWLVVFDNAQRPGDLVGMLPGGDGHVLITTRNRLWNGVATQVDLGEFSRAEAAKFLCQRTGCDEPGAAGELADELGDLPLALAQAAAYIDERSMTVGGYLELYRDPVQARRLRDAGLDSAEYPASVARTWLLSFTQLSVEHPAAVELLRLCAFLDPDDIDLDFLNAGRAETGEVLARVLGNQPERTEAAGALAATSLVTVSAKDHLRVHRLVQAVTRDQLDDGQAAEWAERALNLVNAILPPAPTDYQSWRMYANLAPHIEAVVGHESNYPILAEKISILGNLGIYLSESGQLRAARTTFERVLAIEEAAHGLRHPEVAKAIGNLGQAQLRLGELREARVSIERSLVIFKEAYGPDDPAVAKALGNLGLVQRDLGELRDARVSLERAVAIFQAAYGPNSTDVDRRDLAVALVNLGRVQRDLRELREARASLGRALALNEAGYGSDHPLVGWALVNLGLVQRDLRELREARASFERALAIFQATAYDPDYPAIGLALVNLGAVQLRLRKLRAGLASIQRVLAVFQAAYGPDRRDIMKGLVNLGVVRPRRIIMNYLISLAFKRQREVESGKSAVRS